jgi:Cys-rich four helix bundle protein (predicted Tat secretion target)
MRMSLHRRELLAAAGSGWAMLGMASPALAQTGAQAPTSAAVPSPYPALIGAANECVQVGEECLHHCTVLLSKGDNSMAECARTVQEMLAVARATGSLASQDSTYVKQMASVTAKVTRSCEAACKKHRNHHDVCRRCMESCARLATECEKVAA